MVHPPLYCYRELVYHITFQHLNRELTISARYVNHKVCGKRIAGLAALKLHRDSGFDTSRAQRGDNVCEWFCVRVNIWKIIAVWFVGLLWFVQDNQVFSQWSFNDILWQILKTKIRIRTVNFAMEIVPVIYNTLKRWYRKVPNPTRKSGNWIRVYKRASKFWWD